MLELVTGASFAQLLRREVFGPAGLDGMGLVDTVQPTAPKLVAVYGTSGERKMLSVPVFLGASGNVHASAAELIRAARLIHSTGHILARRSREQLVQVWMAADQYARGGRVRQVDGRPFAWETGKVQAYRTHLAHDLTRDRSIVVLNNGDMDQGLIGDFVEQLVRASA
jgi:D-alanyl-D-alanine carboxypeptidase